MTDIDEAQFEAIRQGNWQAFLAARSVAREAATREGSRVAALRRRSERLVGFAAVLTFAAVLGVWLGIRTEPGYSAAQELARIVAGIVMASIVAFASGLCVLARQGKDSRRDETSQ